MFKILAFSALFVAINASIIPTHYSYTPVVAHATPTLYSHAAPVAKVIIRETPAKYSFEYGVHDSHTGDVKEQHEERDGDVVKGHYSLIDADGTKRTVHYTADEYNGFNAVVEKERHAVHATPIVKAVAPITALKTIVAHHIATPVAYKTAAYVAPAFPAISIAHVAHHAPVYAGHEYYH